MNLVWHIVRKDLRRLWPWLALFLCAIVTRYALGWHIEHHDRPTPILFQRAEIAEALLLGFQLLVGAFFAAQLVHQDTTNNDRAFWITRPIAGFRLLAAKTIALLLALGVLPAIAVLAWWWLHDFRAFEIMASLPAFIARQAALIACSFAVAIFTRDIGGFILTALATALVLWFQIAADVRWTPAVADGVEQSHIVLCLLIAALAVAVCAWLKYQRSHPRAPRAVILASLVTASAIAAFWPFDIITPLRTGSCEPSVAAPIALQMSSADLSPRSRAATFDFKFNNIPEAYRVDLRSVEIRAHFSNATTPIPFSPLGLSPVHDAVARSKVNMRNAPTRFAYRTVLPPATTSAPSLEILTHSTLRREDVMADLRIVTGARTKTGSYSTRISQAHATGQTHRAVSILSTFPARLNTTSGIAEKHSHRLPADILGPQPVERTRRFFILGPHAQPIDAMVYQASLQIDHVRHVYENFHYKTGHADDDRLLHVTYPLLGRFSRTATTPLNP